MGITRVGGIRSTDSTSPPTAGDATTPLLADVITYNPDGTVATASAGGVLSTYTYNASGNVLTETRLGRVKTYTYDGSGNVTGSTVV